MYLQNVRTESAAAASDKEGQLFRLRRDTSDRVRTAPAESHSSKAAHRQVNFYILNHHSTGSIRIYTLLH